MAQARRQQNQPQPRAARKPKDKVSLGEYIGAGAAGALITGAATFGAGGSRLQGLEALAARLPTGVDAGDLIETASWATAGVLNSVGVKPTYAFGIPLLAPLAVAAYRCMAIHPDQLSNGAVISNYLGASVLVGIAGLVGKYVVNPVRKNIKGTI